MNLDNTWHVFSRFVAFFVGLARSILIDKILKRFVPQIGLYNIVVSVPLSSYGLKNHDERCLVLESVVVNNCFSNIGM